MKIEELKRIPIWELLSHLGIEPVSKKGGGAQLMYHSPLRPDRNASFSVSTRKNLWMDFGTSQGGNVIDLAIALKGYCTFSEAVAWLEELTSPRLLEYLDSRGIPPGIGQRYCKEARYRVKEREYYGVAFIISWAGWRSAAASSRAATG